jgi:hypothetical protein
MPAFAYPGSSQSHRRANASSIRHINGYAFRSASAVEYRSITHSAAGYTH